MLKPIHRVSCSPALVACQRLMQRFALWLCTPGVRSIDVTHVNLRAHMPTPVEGDWLWALLARSVHKQTSLDRAQAVAEFTHAEKQGLANWVQVVSTLAQHFGPQPPVALPLPPPNNWKRSDPSWASFKDLMLAFYEPGLQDGLPYQDDGTPTTDSSSRVTYKRFVETFRMAHRLDPRPEAREICVLCGGELRLPAVDHWVCKSKFPLLAVCADNLLPICGECNEAPNKGQKDVHADGSFVDWFHPYLRHANGGIHLQYDTARFEIRTSSHSSLDERRVENLDGLLNLSQRWTREFKAEYIKKQREVEQRRARGQVLDATSLRALLLDYSKGLSAQEPNFEVHRVVAYALLESARTQAFLVVTPTTSPGSVGGATR